MAVKGKGKQIAGRSPASSASSSGKRKRTSADGESSCAVPKKKPSGVHQFVDDAAADADFEGVEEEDDLDWEIDEDFDFELPDIGAKEVKNLTRGPGKSSPLPFFIKEEEMNDDELEEAIKERYRGSGFVSFDEDVKESDQSLLVAHAAKDLSVWRVKCMMGRERQAAFCLMQKFVDLQKIGKKLQIFSVFALDHVKGFFYVEADRACNVFEACNGLCILYPSRIELVPRNEAPNLLSIQRKACGISKGMWVRMKNGKYKGDLAEVVLVNDAKKRVTIKLVPRIDLQAISKKFGGGTSLKAAAIPTPRLISSHELEDFRPHIEIRRDRETGEIFEVLDGLMLKDGYLYKKVSMGSLIHWGVQPTSDELTKFEDLGNDEVKDVGWLSSIYKARMKKKLPETFHQKNGEKSNQKDGEKSNQKDADKQINGFDIDDLVLFGKKSCGIIIDKENDTFKVLKGDVNGSEVVSINIRAIKKICIDKVFTATDRGMKTISIDDVVKVSEGPLEGREGIVRHMYKGVLFIYDECQSENNGFFCANSGICDLVKKSRDLGGGGKLSSRAGPSFAQSPIRLSEQDDNSQSFSRNQQSNSRGTFSVGQTLRIRKGPLKGYLCRVIRMYRADITVKLDSLGKLLTVDEKLLSLPNSKRDDATAMQCNMFGSQEEQLTDGLRDAGGGLGMDNFEFNAGMSSFGRDSWNTPCSSFSFPRENDSKDPNQIADPWGSKLSSWNGDQEQGPANSWGKAASMSAEQSSWNKVESEEKVADSKCKKDVDAWSKASTTVETSTSGWPNDTPVQKTGQTWCSNGDGDGWDNAVHTAVEAVSDPVGWSKAKLSIRNSGEGQTLGEDSWNKAASKIPILSVTETSGWEQTKLPSSDAGGSWNTNGATADWKKDTSGKDRAGGYDRQSGKWASPKSVGGDNQDSWSINGKGFVGNNEHGWVKSAASQEIKPVDKNTWQTSLNSSAQGKTCKTPSADDNQASDWGASSLERSSQTSSWDKEKPAPSLVGVVKSEHEGATEIGGWKKATEEKQVAGCVASAMHSGISSVEEGSQSNSWGKLKSLPSSSGWEKSTETVGSWKTTTDGKQAAGWGSTSMPLAAPSVEHENQTNSWDKLSASPSFDGWQKSKQADATAKEGWKKDGFSSEGQIDKWNKEKSSDRDQASDWNKAGNAGGGKDVLKDSWDKAKSSEGRGFGQESHGHWKAGHDWPNDHNDPKFGNSKDSDSGQGSSWSQGHFNNKSGNNWGHGNSWDQQRDFDGGRGSSRGRGRGRYGGRGGRNEDNFQKPGDSDGGWRFGMGKDRGRNGGGGYSRDNVDTREFGRGRGRGRGQGRGQFESSDWRNKRENFDGAFSNKSSSSWGNTEGSNGWGKSTDEHSAAGMDEKVGWNSGNSYGDGSKPGWGTDPQDAGGSTNDSNVDNASGWSKNVDTGKQIDNWSKGSRRNDNWNTPKTFDTKLSSWNQTNIDTAKGDATSSQSTDWKKNAPNSSDVSFVDWAHGLPVTEGTTNDDKWTRTKSSTGDHGDTLSGNLNSNNWRAAATLNKEKEAGDSQGGWTSKKVDTQASQPSSENENNWGKWKEPCSGSTADGSRNLGSSKDWGNKNLANLDSRSSVWDSKKEPTSSHGNWAGKDSSGNQSSDWNNGDGSKWSKQSGGQGKSEGWSRGSDFGRGGGKGRDNSFSRGRVLGRNSGGRHSYGWNSSVDSGKEGNDGGQAFKTGGSWSRGNDTFEAEKDSWNSGANAEEGSWGSWKSGENQPTAQVQGSGWAASADASPNLGGSKDCPDNTNPADCNRLSSAWDSKKELASMQGNWGGNDSSGKQSSDWNKQSGSQGKLENWSRGSFGRGGAGSFGGGGGRWRGRGLGRNYGDRGSSQEGNDGWQASNSNPEFKTGGRGNTEKASWGSWKSAGENQPAGRAKPGCEADSTKSSWDSPTGIGSNIASGWEPASAKDLVAEQSDQQMNNPWDSAIVSKTGQGSGWNNKKSTGDSGPSDNKQKNHSSEPDHVGSWDTKNAPSEDENSNKPPSLPVQAEDLKWQTSRNTTTDSSSGWGKADNSGNGGANSGW